MGCNVSKDAENVSKATVTTSKYTIEDTDSVLDKENPSNCKIKASKPISFKAKLEQRPFTQPRNLNTTFKSDAPIQTKSIDQIRFQAPEVVSKIETTSFGEKVRSNSSLGKTCDKKVVECSKHVTYSKYVREDNDSVSGYKVSSNCKIEASKPTNFESKLEKRLFTQPRNLNTTFKSDIPIQIKSIAQIRYQGPHSLGEKVRSNSSLRKNSLERSKHATASKDFIEDKDCTSGYKVSSNSKIGASKPINFESKFEKRSFTRPENLKTTLEPAKTFKPDPIETKRIGPIRFCELETTSFGEKVRSNSSLTKICGKKVVECSKHVTYSKYVREDIDSVSGYKVSSNCKIEASKPTNFESKLEKRPFTQPRNLNTTFKLNSPIRIGRIRFREPETTSFGEKVRSNSFLGKTCDKKVVERSKHGTYSKYVREDNDSVSGYKVSSNCKLEASKPTNFESKLEKRPFTQPRNLNTTFKLNSPIQERRFDKIQLQAPKIVSKIETTSFGEKVRSNSSLRKNCDDKSVAQSKHALFIQVTINTDSNSSHRLPEKQDSFHYLNIKEDIEDFLQHILKKALDMHSGITCDFCQNSDFRDYRYKCLTCQDYDLCGNCFEKKKSNKNHNSNHAVLLIKTPLGRRQNFALNEILTLGPEVLMLALGLVTFEDVQCDACGMCPITGIRVKCDSCINYDLCWFCYRKGSSSKSHMQNHAMIAHLTPVKNVFDLETDIEHVDSKEARGCFGSVTKVMYKSSIQAALKKITLNGDDLERDASLLKTYANELFAYGEIQSYNILNYYGYSLQRENSVVNLYLLTEFMENGTLEDVINKKKDYSLRRRFQWILSVIKGIRRMHEKGFVHKDIKPDNILINKFEEAKIEDMGVSAHDQGKRYFKDRLAPKNYAAPEIFNSEKFSNKVDIFSFGLVVSELFTYQKRTRSSIDKVVFPYKSPVFWRLVKKCVKINPNERPTAANIEEQLEMFDELFWKHVKIESFAFLSTDKKDQIFLQITPKIRELLADQFIYVYI